MLEYPIIEMRNAESLAASFLFIHAAQMLHEPVSKLLYSQLSF